MRKSDCVEISTCHCDCHNCIQYVSSKVKNRDELIMYYVKLWKDSEQYTFENSDKAEIERGARKTLTEKEYQVFLFEIQNKGV